MRQRCRLQAVFWWVLVIVFLFKWDSFGNQTTGKAHRKNHRKKSKILSER